MHLTRPCRRIILLPTGTMTRQTFNRKRHSSRASGLYDVGGGQKATSGDKVRWSVGFGAVPKGALILAVLYSAVQYSTV